MPRGTDKLPKERADGKSQLSAWIDHPLHVRFVLFCRQKKWQQVGQLEDAICDWLNRHHAEGRVLPPARTPLERSHRR